MATPKTVRVPGSGLTVIHFDGRPLALVQSIRDSTPKAVAAAQPIQPMDSARPIEIVTAEAIGNGQLTVILYEEFNRGIWRTLGPAFASFQDFVEVSRYVNGLDNGIEVKKYIYRPGQRGQARVVTYHNCVIGEIRDDENVDITTMLIPKEIDILYTHKTEDTTGA